MHSPSHLSIVILLLSATSCCGAQHANTGTRAHPAAAHADTTGLAKQSADVPGGIVISRAMTVAGQEFSQHMVAAWRDMPGSEQRTLVIYERPSARWGSEVWIEYAYQRVYQARLPTARAALRQAGERAAEATFDAVLQADMQRTLVKEADLAADEF